MIALRIVHSSHTSFANIKQWHVDFLAVKIYSMLYKQQKWPQTVFQLAHNDCNYQWHFYSWMISSVFLFHMQKRKTARRNTVQLASFPPIGLRHQEKKTASFYETVSDMNMARGLHTFFSHFSSVCFSLKCKFSFYSLFFYLFMRFVGRTWSHHLSHALHAAAIERAMSVNKIKAIPSITCSSFVVSFIPLCGSRSFFSFHFAVCVLSRHLIVSDALMLMMMFVLVWSFNITLHILHTKFGTKIFWKWVANSTEKIHSRRIALWERKLKKLHEFAASSMTSNDDCHLPCGAHLTIVICCLICTLRHALSQYVGQRELFEWSIT